MDRTQFDQNGALVQPSIADQAPGIQADSQEFVNQEIVDQTTPAPDASTSPPPAPDPRIQLWEQNAPKLQQYEQAFNELRQHLAQAQQQQAESEARTAVQQRLDRAKQLFDTMPPEDGGRFLAQSYEQEMASLYGEIQRERQRAQQQVYQVAAQLSAPVYAEEVGRQHNLPADMVQRLRLMDPRLMDAQVPMLKAELAQRQEQDRKHQALLAQIDQLQRSQQAQAIADGGAHTVGNGGSPSFTSPDGTTRDGSNAHLMRIPGMENFMRGFQR